MGLLGLGGQGKEAGWGAFERREAFEVSFRAAEVGSGEERRYLLWQRHGGRTLCSSRRSFFMPCGAGRAESGSA